MNEIEVKDLFVKTGAFLQGHFKLSSGLHSPSYLQCALVLQNPVIAAKLCKAMANHISDIKTDLVVGPAIGGIVFAYEMARALGVGSIFSERDATGKMVIRRGFSVPKGCRVIIAEDVLTTGGSVKEVIGVLEEEGVTPACVVSLVDRSGGTLDFGDIRYESLLKLDIPTFKEGLCPLCGEGLPIEKPGSRK